MVERTLISFPSQLQLIERLQNLLYLSSSMVFISGEKGAGKSTLIEQLSNQLPEATQQAFITLSEPISIPQVRQQIISQLFEQPLFDADDTLSNTLQLLQEKQPANVARVVVIDNAALLPIPLVLEIAEIIKQKSGVTNNEINFIFLADEPTNEQMITEVKASGQHQDIATLAFKLPPLTAHETQQLLNHVFAQTGYSPKIQHQDALAKQLLNCGGLPEKILLLATEISNGDDDDVAPSWYKTRLPALLLMLLSVAVAGALAVFLYPQFISSDVEAVIETEAFVLEEILASDLQTENTSDAQSTELLAGQWSNDNKAVRDNPLQVGVADDETQRIIIAEQALLELTSSNESAPLDEASPDSENITLESELPVSEAQTSELTVDSEVSNAVDALKQENSELVIAPVADDLIAEDILDDIVDEMIDDLIETTPVKQAPESVKVVITPVPEVLSVSEVVAVQALPLLTLQEGVQALPLIAGISNELFSDNNDLRAINPDLYTVQVSGMSTETSLKGFIKEHNLPQPNVFLYKTIRNDKPWYVFIYGQFENRQLAVAASNNLPNTFSKLSGWVKKYASVHQDLQLNEQ